jgi:hypothetical protein
MPGQYRMLYIVMVLSVQLLLPSAILILAHARSVQIVVQHLSADCTASAPLCYPHTDSCEVSTGCCTAPWRMLNVQLLLPSAFLLLDHAIGQYKILYIIVLLKLSLHTPQCYTEYIAIFSPNTCFCANVSNL